MANYTTRNLSNIKTITSQTDMAKNYTTMLNNVTSLFENDGPVYAVWIRFQIGLNKPITFNSSSTNPKENLIASLQMEKTCAGVANDFTLVIQYDPFNMGQETAEVIEVLDDYIAKSMGEDFDNDLTAMRGKIQYGYNSTSNSNLISPLYTYFITSATSSVRFDSGITTYTFKGVSTLAIDNEFSTNFPAIDDKPLLQVIEETLYYWYGDVSNPPSHISGITPINNDFKYRIDITDEDYNNCVNISVPATSTGQSPFKYCKDLLDANPLTKEEEESELYKDLATLSYSKRPRYTIYLTDTDGTQTIHIKHFAPSSSKDENGSEVATESNNLSIGYTFSWGKKSKNIVTGWNPAVDTQTYLIRKALVIRYEKLKALYEENPDDENIRTRYKNVLVSLQDDLTEMYNATLEIVGIPADPPLGAEITIIPRILETVSRTAGIYEITGCTDNISTSGIYTTKLDLYRLRSTDTKIIGLDAYREETKAEMVTFNAQNKKAEYESN